MIRRVIAFCGENRFLVLLVTGVLVAVLAVPTPVLENAIWIYRDLMFMGKFPVEVYASPVRWALTFGVPIAVMTSFPAQALLGRLSWAWAVYAFALTGVLLALSARFWNDSVARYTSSSS